MPACDTGFSCPLTSVVLQECGPVTRTELQVADDPDWTLRKGVQLVPQACCSPRGFIALCTDDSREVLRIPCTVARQVVGPSGFVPAGTSLLDLIVRM